MGLRNKRGVVVHDQVAGGTFPKAVCSFFASSPSNSLIISLPNFQPPFSLSFSIICQYYSLLFVVHVKKNQAWGCSLIKKLT
jgi:hypothetical protein